MAKLVGFEGDIQRMFMCLREVIAVKFRASIDGCPVWKTTRACKRIAENELYRFRFQLNVRKQHQHNYNTYMCARTSTCLAKSENSPALPNARIMDTRTTLTFIKRNWTCCAERRDEVAKAFCRANSNHRSKSGLPLT